MLSILLVGFVIASIAPLIVRALPRSSPWLLAAYPAFACAWLARQSGHVLSGIPLEETYRWAPQLGVAIALRLDGLSLLFALLIAIVGVAVYLHTGAYLAGDSGRPRFFAFLVAFTAAMFGVVLADDLLALYVAWELTSVTSYFLIGFRHNEEQARASALQALLVTSAGGLALLAGFVLLGRAGNASTISALSRDAVLASATLPAIVALVLTGAFTKSAQFPFHFWLPAAMAAPAPVSAYLHAATMVKAGVYLAARLTPVLGEAPGWTEVMTGVGPVTMLVGAVGALCQTHVKRLLAWSTIGALGMLVFLVGLGTPASIRAALAFLVAHSLYKGALFLVAGTVDHETGVSDVRQMRGLLRAMPLTSIALLLSALAMASLPPFEAFLAKELLYEAARDAGVMALAVAVATSAFFVAIAASAGVRPLFGTPPKAHEGPVGLWVGPLALGGLGLAAGVALGPLSALLSSAAGAVEPGGGGLHLAFWHGWTLPLLLSAATLAAGGVLFLVRGAFLEAAAKLSPAARFGPARAWSAGWTALRRLSVLQTRLLQSGYLRIYLLIVVTAAFAAIGGSLVGSLPEPGDAFAMFRAAATGAGWPEIVLMALLTAGTLGAIRFKSRLAAITSMGVVGYGVALLFVFFGAPDLAMTQFIIETLTVVLFVIAFYHLPRYATVSSRRARARDLALSIAAGTVMATLVIAAVHERSSPGIASYFLEQSLPAAHGRNVVNVILVDFRAADTLGEITVLAIAALGVYSLLQLRPARERADA